MNPSRSSAENDVIEISDDSVDGSDHFNNVQNSSDSSTSFMGKGTINLSDDEKSESDESDADDVQVIEEESESEPEIECDIWDDDCKISSIQPNTTPIEGIHHVKYISLPVPNNVKKMKLSVELNNVLNKSTECYKNIKENFNSDNSFEEKNVCEIITEPWKALVLNNILQDESIFKEITKEFYEVKWNIRNMDLYEFFQSEDIKKLHFEHVMMVYDFLKGDLMSWVSDLSGLELVEVSATCSFYSDTDFLLVHDDQKDTRAVAYVLYFTGVNGWSVDWGGCLQLLEKDENNQPKEVTKQILPKNNQLVLFPVSNHSYHQVQEVQNKNFCRFSINGWFHTKEPLQFEAPTCHLPRDGLYHADDIENVKPHATDSFQLNDWINKNYLDDGIFDYIQSYVEENSESSLTKYFIPEKLDQVLRELKSADLPWYKLYPPNRRKYEYIGETSKEKLPDSLSNFVQLLTSDTFINCLNNYTGLKLVNLRWEIQKWTPGCYSLLCDENKNRLDIMISIGDCDVVGGKTHYVTLEDQVQTALITMSCESNTLNLIYGDTARYTSLISKYSKSNEFYIFFASYYEAES